MKNYEFILYIGVIAFFLILISLLHLKYNFSYFVLVGLTLWGILHMSGGFFLVNGGVLYNLQLIEGILRFDQFIYFMGLVFLLFLHL